MNKLHRQGNKEDNVLAAKLNSKLSNMPADFSHQLCQWMLHTVLNAHALWQNQCKLHEGKIYLNLISRFVNKSSNMVTLPQGGLPLSQLETVKPRFQEVYMIKAGYIQVSNFTGKKYFHSSMFAHIIHSVICCIFFFKSIYIL